MRIPALLVLSFLVFGPLSMASAAKRYTVSIDSLPSGAAVYLEDRAAGSQGTTPRTFLLDAGSYSFILELDGYEPFTRKVTIKKNSSFVFPLTKKSGPATVTLLPAQGTESVGAAIIVNGKEAGKLPLDLKLQAGRYLFEASKDSFETWREWLDIQAGEKRTVTVSLVRSAAGLGSLLIASNITGAEIYVDEQRVDTAPALLEKLSPGKRRIEIRAPGHLPRQQEVTVEAGKTTKVTVELQPDPKALAAAGGTVQVLADQKSVQVLIDGKLHGLAPVKVEGLVEGSHVVEGRKAGYSGAEQTVSVTKGLLTTVKLSLKELPPTRRSGALRVVSPVLQATVFIDGKLVGKTPLLSQQLDPGPHFVVVRAAGYEEFVQPAEVKSGQIVEVKAVLARTSASIPAAAASPTSEPAGPPHGALASPSDEPPLVDPRGLSSYGAQLVSPGHFTADLSLGFAHLIEARLAAGFFSFKQLGMDGGVEFRTYGQVSEIGLHTKLRVLQHSLFSLGVLFSVGGGGGSSGRNTVYSNLGMLASLWFGKLVTFTGRAYLSFYSDRLCPGTYSTSEVNACTAPPSEVKLSPAELRDRVGGTRFFLSAILEAPVTKHIGLFALLEGAPGQGNRLSYSSAFSSYMPDSDPGVYGRLGVTFKF